MQRPLSDLIQSVLPSKSNWKIFLLQQWPTIMGNLQEQVRLEKIQEDNSLVLGVVNTTWMQELYFLADMLLEKINKTLEYPYVKQLRFKYTPRSKKAVEKTKDATALSINSSFKLNAREKEALVHITDPQLREALEMFLMRCQDGKSNEKRSFRSHRSINKNTFSY